MKIYSEDKIVEAFSGACVATIGFFDGVHLGHRFLLDCLKREAEKRGLFPLVLTFPDSPSRVLNPNDKVRLLTTPEEKIRLLNVQGITYVAMLPFSREMSACTAERFMREMLAEKLHTSVLLMGYDHHFGKGGNQRFDDYVSYGKQLGMDVIKAPAFSFEDSPKGLTVSSSSIRMALEKGNLGFANRCLGYEYSLEGEVVGGYRVGASLGYPTANIAVPSLKLVPANGVYAVRVELPGWKGFGMLNIGRRPTLDNGDDVSVEVNIFDFHADIYAERIHVSLVKYIREEQKFDSVETLKKQLQTDEAVCRLLFCV